MQRWRCIAARAAAIALVVIACVGASPPGAIDSGTEKLHYLVLLQQQPNQPERRRGEKKATVESAIETLKNKAAASQKNVISELKRLKTSHRPFWVVNALAVEANKEEIEAIKALPDVVLVESDPIFHVALESQGTPANNAVSAEGAIEWNINKVGAPALWDRGVTGQGIVCGVPDTGVEWDHPALKEKYRGWSGTQVDHNYNWHDAIHQKLSSTAHPCVPNQPAPCDDNGHGTHTAGTMVGAEPPNNLIGAAPGARWIGCRNFEYDIGRVSTYLECLEFLLAPTDLQGLNPRPDLHADIINNSYVCYHDEDCASSSLLVAVSNLRAAGIFVAAAAGNGGNACGTVSYPPGIYREAFTVGATKSTDEIWDYSSFGPVTIDGSNTRKPDLVAPGALVRSSYVPGCYNVLSGTSMASPHAAGVVALLWSAYPALRHDVAATEEILKASAIPKFSGAGCGGDTAASLPNNVFGYGLLDAEAAYELAGQRLAPTPTQTPTATATATHTPSPTSTPTSTSTATGTPTDTPTATVTATATATEIATRTPTATPSSTATPAPTGTPTPIKSSHPTMTPAPGAGGMKDAAPPRIEVFRASGRAGSSVKLKYRVGDDSGHCAEEIEIVRNKRVIALIRRALSRIPKGGERVVPWHAPKHISRPLKFCVRAYDKAGNKSPRRCARLELFLNEQPRGFYSTIQ